MQKTLAEATSRKMIAICRQVFKRGVKSNVIPVNPFDDDERPVSIGAKDKPYINLRLMDDVLAVLPSAEWKAVVELAREAGLRVQSEAPLLKWAGID